jgi:hypothetical protein
MAKKEIVMNIKLDAGEAISGLKDLALNTFELKKRKKELSDEIKAEEKALVQLQKEQAKGLATSKQVTAQQEKLARVTKQNVQETALLEAALAGNGGRTRELRNEVGKLTEENLRFRDKMGEAFSDAAEKLIAPLRTQIKEARLEAQRAFDTFGTGSEEFKKAAEKVDDLIDKQKALNVTINAIDTEGKIETFGKALQGVTGAFSVAQGAAALFGGESQVLEQALLKVQAAMAIQQGISGLVEGAKAAKALALSLGLVGPAAQAGTVGINGMKAALITSGIGAVVVLIGVLAASLIDFGSSTEDAKEKYDAFKKELADDTELKKADIALKQRLEIALRDQARLSEGRIKETKAEIAERLQLEQEGRQAAQKAEEDALKQRAAAYNKIVADNSKSRTAEEIKALREEADAIKLEEEKLAQNRLAIQVAGIEAQNEIRELGLQDEQAAAEKSLEIRKKLTEEQIKLLQEIAQRENALLNERILLEEKLLNEYSDSQLTALQREENAIRDKYFAAINNAEFSAEARIAAQKLMDAELAAARKKAADDEAKTAQDTAEKIKKIQDDIYAYQQDILNKKLALIEEDTKAFTDGVAATRDIALGFGELQQQLTQNELADIDARIEARRKLGQDTTALEAERERVAKQAAVQAFNMQRNAALAQVAIDTAAAISALVAASAKNPANGVTAGAAGAAQFAAGIAQITVQMAKVATLLAQKPPGFAEGGYTGPGGKYEPAGIVHKGEYVLPQEVVRALGVQRLDALRSMYTGAAPGRGSYATGGMVQATLSSNAILAAQNAAAANTMNLQPVLPVESLRAVMNRVEVREARATL